MPKQIHDLPLDYESTYGHEMQIRINGDAEIGIPYIVIARGFMVDLVNESAYNSIRHAEKIHDLDDGTRIICRQSYGVQRIDIIPGAAKEDKSLKALYRLIPKKGYPQIIIEEVAVSDENPDGISVYFNQKIQGGGAYTQETQGAELLSLEIDLRADVFTEGPLYSKPYTTYPTKFNDDNYEKRCYGAAWNKAFIGGRLLLESTGWVLGAAIVDRLFCFVIREKDYSGRRELKILSHPVVSIDQESEIKEEPIINQSECEEVYKERLFGYRDPVSLCMFNADGSEATVTYYQDDEGQEIDENIVTLTEITLSLSVELNSEGVKEIKVTEKDNEEEYKNTVTTTGNGLITVPGPDPYDWTVIQTEVSYAQWKYCPRNPDCSADYWNGTGPVTIWIGCFSSNPGCNHDDGFHCVGAGSYIEATAGGGSYTTGTAVSYHLGNQDEFPFMAGYKTELEKAVAGGGIDYDSSGYEDQNLNPRVKTYYSHPWIGWAGSPLALITDYVALVNAERSADVSSKTQSKLDYDKKTNLKTPFGESEFRQQINTYSYREHYGGYDPLVVIPHHMCNAYHDGGDERTDGESVYVCTGTNNIKNNADEISEGSIRHDMACILHYDSEETLSREIDLTVGLCGGWTNNEESEKIKRETKSWKFIKEQDGEGEDVEGLDSIDDGFMRVDFNAPVAMTGSGSFGSYNRDIEFPYRKRVEFCAHPKGYALFSMTDKEIYENYYTRIDKDASEYEENAGPWNVAIKLYNPVTDELVDILEKYNGLLEDDADLDEPLFPGVEPLSLTVTKEEVEAEEIAHKLHPSYMYDYGVLSSIPINAKRDPL